MIDRINNILISKSCSIINALKIMDMHQVRLLIIVEGNKFINLVSVGDLQRSIINNFDLSTKVISIVRDIITVAYDGQDIVEIKNNMLQCKMECMPIINSDNELIDVIFWDDLFEVRAEKEIVNIPVVIMAGGKGSRMKPITNIIPKPLIPLDERTISEHIIDNFQDIGCNEFYMSVNYKSEMIKDYFSKLDVPYEINFFEEDMPLGTAGSLHLLNGQISSTFFISNCDIIIKEDYREILKYHKQYTNELTIVGSFRHYPIPYGTLETGEDGRLISLQEKPNLNYLINSGMYILEPNLIEEIPRNKFYHITDLIDKIMARNGRVGVFPVSEKSWIDIGEWDKYLSLLHTKGYNV